MCSDKNINILLSSDNIQFGTLFSVNCVRNQMNIPFLSLTLALSEAQKRLLICLYHKVENKNDIIRVVWGDKHPRARDNNYHQLVFQLRKLLQNNGLPPEIIITVPYHGLRMNKSLLFIQPDHAETDYPATDNGEPQDKLLHKILSVTRGLFTT